MSGYRGLLIIALVAVVTGCGDDTLAEAAGHTLSVEEGAEMLASRPEIPNEPAVAQDLAGIWVDYILLAHAAMEDSTFASLDFDPVVQSEIEQQLVFRLREEVIQVDTVIGDDELRELYLEQAPGARVRARHILLSMPEDAEPAQRDSVLALADELRNRAVGGESFAALAEEYSDDPGSGRQGGDLGFFERDGMVEPFADAAFALEPGEVSDPVESMYGIHVIRVEEREVPEFGEVREQFLSQVRTERVTGAEVEFLEQLEESADIRIAEDAIERVREIAERPDAALSGRAGRRALVEYEGGSFTAGEFQEFLQGRPPAFAGQVQEAPDEQLEGLLRGMTRGELLVNEARRLDLDLSDDEKTEIREEARSGFQAAARQTGLHQIETEDGESERDAIDRVVMTKLREIVAGEGEIFPLGPLAFSLRREYDAEVKERGVAKMVERVEELREESSDTTAAPPAPGPSTEPPAPDTSASTPPSDTDTR